MKGLSRPASRLPARAAVAAAPALPGFDRLAFGIHASAFARNFLWIDLDALCAERRPKRSPLRDAAGMLRSLDYAAHGSLIDRTREGSVRAEDAPRLGPWTGAWRQWMGWAFLRSILEPLPEDPTGTAR